MSLSLHRHGQRTGERRGFSLPETLLALLLVFGILGMVAVIMREYSQVARFVDAKARTFDGIQFALSEMSHEVSSAVALIAPSKAAGVGTTSATLEFRRMDPAVDRYWLNPNNFEAEEGDPDGGEPAVWDFRNPNEMMRVAYHRELNGELIRTVNRQNGVSRQKMCDSLTGMLITKQAEDYLQIRVSFQEEKRVRGFVVQTRVWPRQ